jgi:hypothetical protein
LENLKAGKYLLIALKDLNNNNKFDRRKKRWVYQTFYHHSNDTVYELELFKALRLKQTNQASGNRLLMSYEGNMKLAESRPK